MQVCKQIPELEGARVLAQPCLKTAERILQLAGVDVRSRKPHGRGRPLARGGQAKTAS